MDELYGDDAAKHPHVSNFEGICGHVRREAAFVDWVLDRTPSVVNEVGVEWVADYIDSAVSDYLATLDAIRLFRALTDPSRFRSADIEAVIVTTARPLIDPTETDIKGVKVALLHLLRPYAKARTAPSGLDARAAFAARLTGLAEIIDRGLTPASVVTRRIDELKSLLARLPGDNTHFAEALSRFEENSHAYAQRI